MNGLQLGLWCSALASVLWLWHREGPASGPVAADVRESGQLESCPECPIGHVVATAGAGNPVAVQYVCSHGCGWNA